MERQRVRQRVPAFHDSLVSFLFVNFYLKYIFYILCRFTHISFKALDFLYFIPLLNGNNIFFQQEKNAKQELKPSD